jgi:hypothetical protein
MTSLVSRVARKGLPTQHGSRQARLKTLLVYLPINPLMPAVNQLCDKVLAIPGVAEVLKPSVNTLKAKLTALAA